MKTFFLLILSATALAHSELKEFDSKGIQSLLIENVSGKILISAADGPKAKVTTTRQAFSEKCALTQSLEGNRLTLKVKSSALFSVNDCKVDLDVTIPKSINLSINNGSGDVKIQGVTGELVFKTGAGNLVAAGTFKKLDGMSGSGDITIKDLTGSGELKSGSGAINITLTDKSIAGTLDLKLGSGDTTLNFPQGAQVKTTFAPGRGKLSNALGDAPNPKYQVTAVTGSGNLTITKK